MTAAGAIEAIRLVTGDARALAGFYRALGFAQAPATGRDPFGGAMRLRLTLGAQAVELVEVPGAEPAPGVAADDLRFQHFAMIAPDMGAAIARLAAARGWSPITTGGPRTLPERSGGVTAFKFRDPEGHPLELLSFPPGGAPEPWRDGGADLLGIDHTAIVVANTASSLAHYVQLGWTRAGGSLNRGAEQGRLDGLPDPVVEVTTLHRPGAGPPQLELLSYRARSVPSSEGAAPGRDGSDVPRDDPPARGASEMAEPTGGDVAERADPPIGASHRPGSPAPDTSALATRTAAGGTRPHRDPDGHRWLLP